MLGGIMSPQSFYLAMVILGCGGLAYFSWPVAQRVWEIPKRRREREREALKQHQKMEQGKLEIELKIQAEVISTITDLRQMLSDHSYILYPDQNTKVLLLKQTLIDAGVVSAVYSNEPDIEWQDHLAGVLPYIIRRGIEQGVAQYQRDTDREIFDDDDDDESRTE